MKKLIIFDLDGTLLNTIADLAHSTNHALQTLGYPTHEVASYNFMVGNGINRRAPEAPTARTPRYRPATSGMPWTPFIQRPAWDAPGSFSAAPRPSTALWTALWGRESCVILCLNTARISWRYAAGRSRPPGPWALITSTPGYSVSTARRTTPGPWCQPAWIPSLRKGAWSLGPVPSSGISFM